MSPDLGDLRGMILITSPFDILMASANTTIFAQFGVAAIYTPVGGSPVACTVIFDEGVELIGDEYGRIVDKTMAISLLRAEVDRPVQGDAIQIGDKTYLVEGDLKNDSAVVVVRVRHG
jgi:hypothetical protein